MTVAAIATHAFGGEPSSGAPVSALLRLVLFAIAVS
jgi:hypothetical protein